MLLFMGNVCQVIYAWLGCGVQLIRVIVKTVRTSGLCSELDISRAPGTLHS